MCQLIPVLKSYTATLGYVLATSRISVYQLAYFTREGSIDAVYVGRDRRDFLFFLLLSAAC